MIVFNNWRAVPEADWRWPHFTPQELACRCHRHCDGLYHHDPTFLDKLEKLREAVGRSLIINSGTRCPLHNALVGGAPLSQHKIGCAVDISVAGWSDSARYKLMVAARLLGFGGIGYANSFLHLDNRSLKPGGRPAQWDYVKGGMKKWTSLMS